MLIRRVTGMLTAATIALLSPVLYAGQSNPPTYLERLRERTVEWQKALPELRASASSAAARIMAGGNLYVTGPQGTFPAEANGRAGGLMLTRWYSPALTNGDVVLAAVTATNQSAELQRLVATADRVGATVILFGCKYAPQAFTNASFCALPAKPFAADSAPQEPDIESLSNLIGLWAWTGEFISACVAHGKMPCVYESFGMPGGPERGQALNDLKFHETTTVAPAGAKDLGGRFLQKVEMALKQANDVNRAALARAAAMIRNCHSASNTVYVDGIGHTFPAEFRQPPTPAWFKIEDSPGPRNPGDLTVFLGYQAFPWDLARSTSTNGSQCIIACSHLAPPEFEASHRNVYLNPFWDVQDGCVDLKGYDVRLLPLSDIMGGAIYWQLVDLVVNRSSSAK